jgi:hypothetical protein
MVGNKALGLVGNSERVLMTLALKYELVTGVQVKWRQDHNAIYAMVDAAIKSDNAELVDKAIELLEVMPEEVRHQFVTRGIEPLPRQPNKLLKYRGVAIESTTQRDNPTTKKADSKAKIKSWRGAVSQE